MSWFSKSSINSKESSKSSKSDKSNTTNDHTSTFNSLFDDKESGERKMSFSLADIDDSMIEVSEEDLDDPEYLNMLGELMSDNHEDFNHMGINMDNDTDDKAMNDKSFLLFHNESDIVNKEQTNQFISTSYEEQKHKTSDIIPESINQSNLSINPAIPTVESLKADAIAYSRAGHTAMGIEALRQAKALANDGSANEKRISEVINISNSRPVTFSLADESVSLADESVFLANESVSLADESVFLADESVSLADNSNESVTTATGARRKAIELKRLNRTEEALQWIRYAKSIEAEQNSNSTGSNKIGLINPNNEILSKYESNISKLKNAKKQLIYEAKSIKLSQPSIAINKMKQIKVYDEYIDKLSTYKLMNPLPKCPSIKQITKQIVVKQEVNNELGDNSFQFKILSINNFQTILNQYIGYNLSIHYELSIPIDNPIQGQTQLIRISKENINNLIINYDAKYSIIRKSSYAKILLRKKIKLNFIIHRGFLLSNVTVGIALIPLASLVEMNTIYSNDTEILSHESNKSIGGSISTYIGVRYPYGGTPTKVLNEIIFEITEWPTSHEIKSISFESHELSPNEHHKSDNNDSRFNTLSEKEKYDPLNIDYYISNDVLDKEIESLTAQIDKHMQVSNDSGEDEDLVQLQMRRDLLKVKLAVLVSNVQLEKLSLEEYIDSLRVAVKRDKLLAMYCDINSRKKEALEVMRRVLAMEKEINSAADV